MVISKVMSSMAEIQVAKKRNRQHKSEGSNIALYLTAKTVSLLGTNIYNFALSLYILKITGSGASFAINILAGMLPRIVLGPFAGILADRIDRKKITTAFDALSGLVVLSLLGISSAYGLRVIFIYITGFILSAINVFYDTSLTSAIPSLVTDKKLMKINSYTAVSISLAGVLSPVLGGIIYSFIPIRVFLVINSLSFFMSCILEVFINFNLNKSLDSSKKAPMTIKAVKNEFKEVLAFLKSQQFLYSLLKYLLIVNVFLNASLYVVYPYIINNVLRMSTSNYGNFQGAYFLGMIVISLIVGNKKDSDIKISSIAVKIAAIGLIFILMGVPTIGLSIFKVNPFLFSYNVILLFSFGAILIAMNIPMLVTVQKLTPENLRGRITGFLGTLTGGIAPLGIIFAGLIIDKVQPFIILLVSGTCTILSALAMLKSKLL